MRQMSSECPQTISTVNLPDECKVKGKEQDGQQSFSFIFKDTLRQYQETASIHGVSRTLHPQLYTCRWLIWALLVGVMAVLLAVTLKDLITDLQARPIKTINKITLHDELPFPAVTFCSLNQFNIDHVPQNDMIRHVLLYKSEYAGVRGYAAVKDLSNVTDVPGDELFRVTQDAAPRLRELFYGCSWRSKRVDCADIFRPVNTTFGKCFIFNGDKSNVRVAKMSGFRESLKVIIDVHNKKSFFSQFMEAGVFLLITDQDTLLVPQNDGYTLRPGVSANIRLTRTDNIRLPYPYKAFSNSYCEDTESESYVNKIQICTSYSLVACLLECQIKHVLKQCGCKGFNVFGDFPICSAKQYLSCFIPESSDFPICSAREYVSCYIPEISQFSQAELLSCGCREQCKTRSYELEVFYADFASSFIYKYDAQENLSRTDLDEKRLFEATIYYKSLNVQTYEQQPAVSMFEVLGKLGGQMGLFLGMSVLSFAEIVEAFFLLIYRCLKACRTRLSSKVGNQAKMRRSSTVPNRL